MRAFGTGDELDPGRWGSEPGPGPETHAHEAAPSATGATTLVRALHHELIPTLARKHRGELVHVTDSEVERFTADLLRDDEAALQARLEHLRRQGLSARHLCHELLAPAARRLGMLWDDDRCDFVQVTLGLGHLQRLLRELGPRLGAPATPAGAGLHLLLAQLSGEHHSFGASMAVHHFQAEGWAVTSAADASVRVGQQHFDAVGFSAGSELMLDPLRRQIAAVRAATRNPALVVIVGGPVFALHPSWAHDVGADSCPAQAHEAALQAARLVRTALV